MKVLQVNEQKMSRAGKRIGWWKDLLLFSPYQQDFLKLSQSA